MATTARLPAEVEDLLAEHGGASGAQRMSFASAAGHIIVAGSKTNHALLFRINGGPTHEPFPIRMQRPFASDSFDKTEPPAIVAWEADFDDAPEDRCPVRAIGLASLTKDGTLRVFDRILVQQTDTHGGRTVTPSFRELRVTSVLAASLGGDQDTQKIDACSALAMVHLSPQATGGSHHSLVVLGSQGSAAIVRLGSDHLTAAPIADVCSADEQSATNSQTSSYGFSTRLFSALRRGRWSDSRHDEAAWKYGIGDHAIVGCGPDIAKRSEIICIRHGGEVEKWGTGSKQWTCNMSKLAAQVLPEGASDIHIMKAVVSTEEVVASLVRFNHESNPHHAILTLDGSYDTPPHGVTLALDLGLNLSEHEESLIAISSDILFVYPAGSGTVTWISIAQGICTEDQSKGFVEVSMESAFVTAIDCVSNVPGALSQIGGHVAFIDAENLLFLSAYVPPPLSSSAIRGLGRRSDGRHDPSVIRSLFWRSYLLYAAGQSRACTATLETFLTVCSDSQHNISWTTVDDAVRHASRGIVDNIQSDSAVGGSIALLVDTKLEEKVRKHKPFLKMMSDVNVLSNCHHGSISKGDRLWDCLTNSARSKLVADAEKLASACRVRQVENAAPFKFHESYPSSQVSAFDSSRSRVGYGTRISSPAKNDCTDRDDEMGERGSVVEDALAIAGTVICETEKSEFGQMIAPEDASSAPYAIISMFHVFMPALLRALHEAKVRFENKLNSLDQAWAGPGMFAARRQLSRNIVIACEAVLAAVQSAAEVREDLQATHSFTLGSMEPAGGWSCDPKGSRDVLHGIIDMSLEMASLFSGTDSSVLHKCAVSLSDVLLSCIRSFYIEQELRSGSRLGSSGSSATKRRRLDAVDTHSALSRDRNDVLDRLISVGLHDDAFILARKHEDFGKMLSLKLSSPDFNQVVENGIADFGRSFAMFAFRWLEDRGEIKLLLFGRNKTLGKYVSNAPYSESSSYAPRKTVTENLLRDYFASERKEISNFSWITELASSNFMDAACCVHKQAVKLSVPGKPSSLANSRLLLSLAKLAALSCDSQDSDSVANATAGPTSEQSLRKLSKDVDRRLYLVRAQMRLLDVNGDAEASRTLLPVDDLIRRFMDEAPTDTAGLTEATVIALECLSRSELPKQQARKLTDHVWRRCIEQQSQVWLPFSGSRSLSDSELRMKIAGTAFFEATKIARLSMNDVKDLVSRDVFRFEEFVALGRLPQLYRLLVTTVQMVAETLDTMKVDSPDRPWLHNVEELGRLSIK